MKPTSITALQIFFFMFFEVRGNGSVWKLLADESRLATRDRRGLPRRGIQQKARGVMS